MADSYNKKEREKKKQKKKREKAERKLLEKLEGKKQQEEFMYLDENGNLTSEKPDPAKKKVFIAEDIYVSVPKKEDLEAMDSLRNGKVKFFNSEKGYGFIADTETRESYFVHINNVEGDEITENNKVTFEIGSGPKGPIAINVKILS